MPRVLALALFVVLAAVLLIKTTTGRSWVFSLVAGRIEARSGIALTVGSSRLSVLGGRIILEDVKIQAAGHDRPFVTAGEVDASFAWRALLSRPIRLQRVLVRDVEVDPGMLPEPDGEARPEDVPFLLDVEDLRWESAAIVPWDGGEKFASWFERAVVDRIGGIGTLTDGVFEVSEASAVLEVRHPNRPPIEIDIDLAGRIGVNGAIHHVTAGFLGRGLQGQATMSGADPGHFTVEGTLEARLGTLFPDLTSSGQASIDGRLERDGDRFRGDGDTVLTQLPAALLEPLMRGPLSGIALDGKHIDARGNYRMDLPLRRTGDAEHDHESIDLVAEAKLMHGSETLLSADLAAVSNGDATHPIHASWEATLLPEEADRRVSTGSIRLTGWNRVDGALIEEATLDADFADLGAAAERFGLLDDRVEVLRPLGSLTIGLSAAGLLARPEVRGDLRWHHEGDPVLEVTVSTDDLSRGVFLRGAVLADAPGVRVWRAELSPHPEQGWAAVRLADAHASIKLPDPYGAGEQFSAIHHALMPGDPTPAWVDLLLSADPSLGGALTLELDAEGPLTRPRALAVFSWRPGADEVLSVEAEGRFDLATIERSEVDRLDATSRNLSLRRLAALFPPDLAARVHGGQVDAVLRASGTLGRPEADLILHGKGIDFEGLPAMTRLTVNVSTSTQAWTLNDLVAEWADPSFGVLQAGATIEPGYPVRRFSARVAQLGLRGPGERAAVVLEFRDGVLRFESGSFETTAGQSGTFEGVLPLLPEYEIVPLVSAAGEASLLLDRLDIGSIAALWPDAENAPQIAGELSGSIDVDLQRIARARGRATLAEFRFVLGEEKIRSVDPLEFVLDEGQLTLLPGRLLAASSTISGEAPLDVSGTASLDPDWRQGSPLASVLRNGTAVVDGTVNASLLAPIIGATGSGPVELHLEGAGRPGDFSINGTMRGENASVLLSEPYATRIGNFDVAVHTRGSEIVLDRITADVNGGSGSVDGVIDPVDGTVLNGRFEGVRYRLGFGITTRFDADIRLDWPTTGRRRLSGNVVIERALMNRDINLDREILRAILDPALEMGTSHLLDTVDLDLSVHTDQGLIIRNNLAELRADWTALDVRGTLADPLLTGVAEVAPGGRLHLPGETLRIDAASLTWSDAPPGEPVISSETTSSREDPAIGQSWRGAWYTTDLGPGQGGTLGFRETATATATAEGSLGTSLATYTQDRLYGSLDRVLDRTELSYEPLPLFGETDTEARFTVSQQFSKNVTLIASDNPREAEGQTYILDLSAFRTLPSLRAQIFTGERGTKGATLQQTLILGDKDRGEDGDPRVRERSLELPDVVRRRPIKRALGFRKGDPFAVGAELDVEIDVAGAMRQAGYPDATVTVRTDRAEKNRLDLSVSVDPGPLIEFSFEGPRKLSRSIRGRVRAAYRSGDEEPRTIREMQGIGERALRAEGCLAPLLSIEPIESTATESRRIRIEASCASEADPAGPILVGLPPDVAEFVASGFGSRLSRIELAVGVPDADRYLLRTLDSLGYPEAHIDARELSADGTRLEVFIESGPRCFVAAVTLENADETTRLHAKGLLSIRKGDPLRRDWISASARALEADLRSRGHDAAIVRPLVERDADDPTRVSVAFRVEAGRPSEVRQVKIEGLRHANPAWVANVTALSTNTLLRRDEISAARGRLYRTGVFERIRVTTESIEDEDAEVAPDAVRPMAISFEVDEAPRYQLSYGGRWDSDIGLGGVVDLVNRNTLGRGHRTGVRGILNNEERSLRMYHQIPSPLRSEKSSLEVFVEAKRETIEDVKTEVVEGWAQLTFPLSERMLARVYTAVGNREILSGIPPPEIPLEEQVISPRFGWQLAYNTVREGLANQRRKGVFLGIDVSGSHANLGSDLTTFGLFTQFKVFAPFGSLKKGRFSWHQSYRTGSLTAREQPIPFVDRLRAGGEYSVRGYPTNSLGPLAPDGTPLGGELLFVVNQEFHARLFRSLYGVVFFDAGNVWASRDDFELDLFRSVGVGARYTSPVGPLRFDVGFPLDRRTNEKSYQMYVGFGSVF